MAYKGGGGEDGRDAGRGASDAHGGEEPSQRLRLSELGLTFAPALEFSRKQKTINKSRNVSCRSWEEGKILTV